VGLIKHRISSQGQGVRGGLWGSPLLEGRSWLLEVVEEWFGPLELCEGWDGPEGPPSLW